MDDPVRIVYLYHNRILTLPLINSLLYKLQIFLYEKELINIILISSRKNKLRSELLKRISKRTTYLICRSFKFGRLLYKIKCEKILDINIKNTSLLNEKDIYSLMWTLVFTDFISSRTKKSLTDFIPANLPIKHIAVIPFNDSFDLVCDYILQTAKTLSRKGFLVQLIALGSPISIFKLIFRFKNNYQKTGFFLQNNIVINFPLSFVPTNLQKINLMNTINRKFMILYSVLMMRIIKADYLWCFDPTDYELVEKTKNTTKSIYDCADYFSTLNTDVNKKIRTEEEKLIKMADYFFVNSKILFKTKKVIKKPNAVVPQGFDLESFDTNLPLSLTEKGEIKNVGKIFSKINKPIIGYVGNITYRLDFKLLSSLVRKMPNVAFVFTDAFLSIPLDDSFVDTKKRITELRKAKNIYFVPKTQHRRVVKEILRNIDIGMIPYNIEFDFNRYCYPMKLFEYFYQGIPVISTPIEELRRFPDFVKIGNSDEDWEKIINELIARQWPIKNSSDEKTLAVQNSWEMKIDSILNILNQNISQDHT